LAHLVASGFPPRGDHPLLGGSASGSSLSAPDPRVSCRCSKHVQHLSSDPGCLFGLAVSSHRGRRDCVLGSLGHAGFLALASSDSGGCCRGNYCCGSPYTRWLRQEASGSVNASHRHAGDNRRSRVEHHPEFLTAIADEFHASTPDGRPYLGMSLRQYDAARKAWIVEYLRPGAEGRRLSHCGISR
jgi:hypothetical protein